jgi:hypothetical protein
MGHRSTARFGHLLLASGAGALLSLAAAHPAGASGASGTSAAVDPPAEEPSSADDTLLPPDSDVSIVPVDQAANDPPAQAGDPGPADRSDPFDLGDIDPGAAAGWGLLALVSLAATGIATSRLARTLHVWRSPASVRASGFGPVTAPPAMTFSLLVPACSGNPRLWQTLDQLATLDHPAFEILVVVGQDDHPTSRAARAAAAGRFDRVRVVMVEEDLRHSRAAGLNAALAQCRGRVVGVFGAGDEVHPQLLRHVDACLANGAVAALQGGVQLVAPTLRWFTLRHVIDRYFWYRSRLHFHAQQHFMPLDETTVFVRADVLRGTGGWHRDCVAEGCDLGVRLSVDGATVVAGYDPQLVTRKDAPDSARALMREETRRIRGFLQVLRMGVWRRLPTRRQRLLARAMLARPFVEAVTALAINTAVVWALVAGAPTAIALLALVPAVPGLTTLGVEMAGLAELYRRHGQRVRVRDQLGLALTVLPYQALQTVAALRALGAELGTLGRRKQVMPIAPAEPPTLRPMNGTKLEEHQIIDVADRADHRRTPAPEVEVSDPVGVER